MGKDTDIPWADHTWNPWQGCRKVSAGCENCYMFRDKNRYQQDPTDIHRSSDHTFNLPNRIKEPGTVFVCSWSDFFIEEADEWRDEAWEIMRKNKHLTFLLLTKRPENIDDRLPGWVAGAKNIWLGATVENQFAAMKRIPILIGIYFPRLFLSIEPMIGPVNLGAAGAYSISKSGFERNIDWVIVGGESGPKARDMLPAWAVLVMTECELAGIPFFMKQMSGNTIAKRERIPLALNVKNFPRF